MEISDEERTRRGDRNRERAYYCARCGHFTERKDGSELAPESHFAGITYKVCNGCGHEEALRTRKRKGRL